MPHRAPIKEAWLLSCAPPKYIRNNMGQKCEGNCGLWVLNEIILKYHENLKKNSESRLGVTC